MIAKKKSKTGTYLSIGTSLFAVFGVVKQLKSARREHDNLEFVDALVSAASIATGLALLARELRRKTDDSDTLAG
ncbi:hypothetical protein GCM10009716_23920 [Streptomyces sodiiphilus]|uniref:DUF4235 domain-containing protein n=1 Tax=Streptomyces sodiiphilus TaxID=226217 RepID=A0ABN2P650_9ACTN